MQQAGAEFAASVAGQESLRLTGEVAALKAELTALKTAFEEARRNPDLRGEKGIDVKGNIITLRKAPESTGTGGTGSLEVKNEGTTLTSAATSVDFVGSTVNATTIGAAVTVTITSSNGDVQKDGSLVKAASAFINFKGGGVAAVVGTVTTGADVTIPGVDIQFGGSLVTTATTFVNFTGAATVTTNALGTNVAIPGTAVIVQQDASNVVTTATVNFTGDGVDVDDVGGVATVDIPGGEAGYDPFTAIFFKYDGTDISAVQLTFKAKDEEPFAP